MMNFFTRQLVRTPKIDKIIEEKHPTHDDLLFDRWIRKTFVGNDWIRKDGISGFASVAACKIEGNSIFVRPRDPSTYRWKLKKYGIADHPKAIELEARFKTDKNFWLEFSHDAETNRS